MPCEVKVILDMSKIILENPIAPRQIRFQANLGNQFIDMDLHFTQLNYTLNIAHNQNQVDGSYQQKHAAFALIFSALAAPSMAFNCLFCFTI